MYMPVWGAGGIVVVVEDEGGVCANKISTKMEKWRVSVVTKSYIHLIYNNRFRLDETAGHHVAWRMLDNILNPLD